MAEARDHLADLVESVQKTYDRVTLTRHGQPAAVLIAAGDLDSLLETLEVLSTPGAAGDIQEGLAEYAAHKAGRRSAAEPKRAGGKMRRPTGVEPGVDEDSPADRRR